MLKNIKVDDHFNILYTNIAGFIKLKVFFKYFFAYF